MRNCIADQLRGCQSTARANNLSESGLAKTGPAGMAPTPMKGEGSERQVFQDSRTVVQQVCVA